jgi:TonB-linked SusC/RagA family outer membrane protein
MRFNNTYFLIFILSLFTSSVFSQSDEITYNDTIIDTQNIRGIIIDSKNKPIEYVSISIDGLDVEPVFTDSTGTFNFELPSGDFWLLIKPLSGYHSQRVFLDGRQDLKIVLTNTDFKSSNELIKGVITDIPRKNMVNSYEDPDPENLDHELIQSVDQFVSGKIAGLYGMSKSAMPGDGVTLFLRGIKSMNTNNQPLYLVDGIPIEPAGIFESHLEGFESNPLNTIDPFDITNITVLKDNLGTSVYGMQGSNGVILIETLKPSEVETTIDFSLRAGIASKPQQIPQLNAGQHRTLANETLSSSTIPEETFPIQYPGLFYDSFDDEYVRYSHNTNWQDQIFSSSKFTDAYIKVRGGDEIARYGLSVGYLNHEGIVKNTDYNRYNIRFVGTFNMFKWLRMYVNTNLNSSSGSLKESILAVETSPIRAALMKSPMMSPYKIDENGDQLQAVGNVEELGISNPLAIIENYNATYKNTRFLTSVRFRGDITSDIKLNSILGLNINQLSESIFMPNKGMVLYYDGEAYNVIKSQKNAFRSVYSESDLTYSKELNRIHQISAKVGIRVHTNDSQSDWALTKNSQESDQYTRLSDGISFLRDIGGDNHVWNRLAGFTSVGYSYRDKYMLYANLTTEFSSLVGDNATNVIFIDDHPFGLFYAAGIGWKISSESFMSQFSFLDELKLRASYGKSGNDDIGVNSSQSYYSLLLYRETSAMVPSILSNQTQTFESISQLNTGLDISLWGSRINVTADIYQQLTSDLLVYSQESSFTGFDYSIVNDGIITNNGWEIALSTRILDDHYFKWDFFGNISSFKNKVVKIRNTEIITPFEGGEFISREGGSILEFYGLQYNGVYETSEMAEADGLVNADGLPFGAGDASFIDISGPEGIPDKVIDDFDKTGLGSPIPDMFGGIGSSISYKNFTLSVFAQFVSGREVFNYTRYQNEKMTDLSNQSTAVLNRWTFEGQKTDVPRVLWNDPIGNSSFSSRWIEDGAFIRINNLSLSYTIPDEVLFFRNLHIYITGINLFTFNKYLGYDPEFSYSSNVMLQGIDYGKTPQTRKFLIGVKIGL